MKKPKKDQSSMSDDKDQSRLFIETAREIGADEDKSAADSILGRLVREKPEPRKSTRNKG